MSRLPNITDRDQVPEHLREAYDQVAGQRQGVVSGPYGVLLHSPELALRSAALSNYLRWHSDLTPAQREIAVLVTARHLDADVMWGSHVALGREAGVRDVVVEVIARRADVASLTDEEADIVRYVRELLEANRVNAPTFDALRARVGDRGVVDLTGLVGYYCFVGVTLNAFEVEAPPDAARLP